VHLDLVALVVLVVNWARPVREEFKDYKDHPELEEELVLKVPKEPQVLQEFKEHLE
jgi:hypothetical protein